MLSFVLFYFGCKFLIRYDMMEEIGDVILVVFM